QAGAAVTRPGSRRGRPDDPRRTGPGHARRQAAGPGPARLTAGRQAIRWTAIVWESVFDGGLSTAATTRRRSWALRRRSTSRPAGTREREAERPGDGATVTPTQGADGSSSLTDRQSWIIGAMPL